MTFNQLRRLELVATRRLTLANFSDRLATIWGDRTLMTSEDGESLSYDEAANLVEGWSNHISANTAPGDRVVIATSNSYVQFLLCLAASRAATLPVPVNSQMRETEIDHVIADSGASLTIRDASELPLDAAPCVPAEPKSTDVAALFYTSGTTGKPKGAALTHRSLVGQAGFAVLWPAQLRNDEVVVALPVAHIMGFATLIGMAAAAMPVFFMGRFRAPQVLDAIEQRRPSAFIGVPSMYRMLEEAGAADRNLGSIRMWISGADVMPVELARQFKKFGASVSLPLIGDRGEAAFVEGYGMVEVGGGVAAKISPPLLPIGIGDSVGFRLPGYKFRVVDESDKAVLMGKMGELWVKGPGVLDEYWNAPDATRDALTADGWLRTGDLVRVGPMGTIVFCGRLKQTIKSGGYSVYPLEIEERLEEHPDVLEASVVGMADAKLGEVPVAAVRVVKGSTTSGDDLVVWAALHLSNYKAPKRVVIVEELPRTGTAKVQKEHLVDLFV